MLQKLTVSQTGLKTQYKILTKYKQELTGTATEQGYQIYPLTKLFINKYITSNIIKQQLLDYINKIIKAKTTKPIIDNRLREYQKQDVAAMLRFKRVGLFNEQRLGKTPTVLSVLARIKEPIKTLIIAPKSTHIQWENETMNWYTKDVKRIRGQKKQRISYYNDPSIKVFIITYETAHIDFNYLLPIINCVVLDEAHRIRNFKGERSTQSPAFTKSVVKLGKKAKYVYALTGTPAPSYSYQIYPILHILYPNTFSSYWKFIDYYYETEIQYLKNIDLKKVIGFKNKEKEQELQEFLNINYIQRKRKDYMQWIPNTDKKIINLELDKKTRKWYNELYDTWECKELNFDCPNKLTLIQKLLYLTSDTINGPKTKFILDYIKDYPEEQIIIATQHTSYLKELQKLIPNSKLMIGETTSKERGKLAISFNKKEYNILLGNIDVIKEGIKLEQGNTIIIVTPSFVYSDNLQMQDRIIPTNKELAIIKNKQQIIKLVCKDTIDDYVEKQLRQKKSSSDIVNNFITNGRRDS